MLPLVAWFLAVMPLIIGAVLGGVWAYRSAAKDTYQATGWCMVCRRYRRAEDRTTAHAS
jgi:hypothetical protein